MTVLSNIITPSNVLTTTNTATVSNKTLTSPVLTTPTLGVATATSLQGIIGNVTPAAGAFTTVDASGAVTLSGGTANGVTYLNGSKVLTSGSALQFNGTALGIGTSVTPSKSLTIYNASIDTEIRLQSSTKDFYLSQRNSTGQVDYIVVDNAAQTWSVNNTEGMRLTSTGLGIGTSSPTARLQINGTTDATQRIIVGGSGNYSSYKLNYNGSEVAFFQTYQNSELNFGTAVSAPLMFFTNNTERAKIASNGNFYWGCTGVVPASMYFTPDANGGSLVSSSSTGTKYVFYFQYNNSTVGYIYNTSGGTTYNTTSDYRLKENIAPMTGALAKVAQLKPSTYKWKHDGSDGQGFIAHELQEFFPDAVVGVKDDVDANGKIKPQGIDTSFLVATLTAAIQEQQALIQSLKARLDAANL
jgi:hypothetical protein